MDLKMNSSFKINFNTKKKVSMMEVKILKIDIDTGYAQYQTSIYPAGPEYLGVEIPQLVEIYKENRNFITTRFLARSLINVNGVTYTCSSRIEAFFPFLWTVRF